MKDKNKIKTIEVKQVEDTYSKKQIVKSRRFANYVDLLNATLNDSKKYTLKQVEETIINYMKGKVN